MCKDILYFLCNICSILHCKFVHVYFWLVPPTAFMTHLCIHGMYVWIYECMYVCSYKSSVLTLCTTSYIQQDRRCTYKVRLRRFRATIVAVEQNKSYIVWMCVSRLIYPPCNVHDPYCLLYPAIPYVANLSQKRHNFQKSLLNLKCCFVFLYNFCLKYFLF